MFVDEELQQQQERAQRVAGRISTRSIFRTAASGPHSSKGHSYSSGVVVRGSYRYHKGSKAKHHAGGRLASHCEYIAGDQHKAEASEKRQIYDDLGNKISSEQASIDQNKNGIFIEHRQMIAPAGQVKEEHLHVMVQSHIEKARAMNPDADITAVYAIHKDTEHPHAHVILTSPNKVRFDKDDYQEFREHAQHVRLELERERGNEMGHQDEIKDHNQIQMNQSDEGREM